MANRFVLNETSYHGAGAINEVANEAKKRGFVKALVCSGPTIYKHGVTGKVLKVLDDAGLTYEVFTDIKEIVKTEDIPFLAQSAYDDACRPGNPKETSVEDITKLYESLM